jgi:hypothetical protein
MAEKPAGEDDKALLNGDDDDEAQGEQDAVNEEGEDAGEEEMPEDDACVLPDGTSRVVAGLPGVDELPPLPAPVPDKPVVLDRQDTSSTPVVPTPSADLVTPLRNNRLVDRIAFTPTPVSEPPRETILVLDSPMRVKREPLEQREPATANADADGESAAKPPVGGKQAAMRELALLQAQLSESQLMWLCSGSPGRVLLTIVLVSMLTAKVAVRGSRKGLK